MVQINRRTWLVGTAAATAAALLHPHPASAQSYPQRPVKIIVPYAPGGGTDVFSRLLAAQMERDFGQSLIIDNRAGGGSIIGTQQVANAPPDGYTTGMMDSAFVTNPGLFKDKLPYDTRKDFIPVSLLSRTQLVLCVHPSSPFKSAQELVAHAKANPGKLTLASAGIGTGIHLASEQLRQATGIEFVTVPYRGGGPARGLAVTRGRAPQLPDIPSMEEVGLGSIDSASEMGLIVPAATPEAIVEKLRQSAVTAVKNETFARNLLERGFQPIGSSTEEFRAHNDREIEKWIRVIAAGNIKPE
jgi:tripartite-type tricarboxylate transporter receptor subunit TctC